MLFYMLKNSYLCSVDNKDGKDAQGSEKFVSGLQKFSPCPERKNSLRKSAKRVNQPQTTNFRFFITILKRVPLVGRKGRPNGLKIIKKLIQKIIKK